MTVRQPTDLSKGIARDGAARKSGRARFVGDPTDSGYENAVGECGAWGTRLTVNRATDLDGTFPSMGMKFRCFNCDRQLQLGSDIANHPIDQIVYDAYRPLLRREYMQAMLMVAQSLEWSLAMCVYHVVLGGLPRPKRIRSGSPINRARLELDEQMDRLTLGSLRTVVAGLGVNGSFPTKIAEAREAIATLKKLTGGEPKPSRVAAISNSKLRDAIERLLAARGFVKLRNQIAHHGARPLQALAERYYEEIPDLARSLLRGFGVLRGQFVMPPRAGGRRRSPANFRVQPT